MFAGSERARRWSVARSSVASALRYASANAAMRFEAIALGRVVLVSRARAGMTQKALASRSGLRRQYLGEVERGRVNPSLATIFEIANGLGRRPSVLLAEVEALMEGNDQDSGPTEALGVAAS